MNATLKAKVVSQPSNEIVQEIGQKFTLAWTFQNVGETAWPLDVLFLRANGDEIESSTWIATKAVGVKENVTLLVEFTAPQKPGKYFACYRLVQGDNNRFGDKVFLNLTVKDQEASKDILIGADQKVEQVVDQKKEESKEEAVLLQSQKLVAKLDAEDELDNSIEIVGSDKADPIPLGSALIEDVEPVALQTGEKPPADVLIQEKDKADIPLAESLKIVESNGPSSLAEPVVVAAEPKKEEYTGDDSMMARCLQSEFDKADKAAKKDEPKAPATYNQSKDMHSMDKRMVRHIANAKDALAARVVAPDPQPAQPAPPKPVLSVADI